MVKRGLKIIMEDNPVGEEGLALFGLATHMHRARKRKANLLPAARDSLPISIGFPRI